MGICNRCSTPSQPESRGRWIISNSVPPKADCYSALFDYFLRCNAEKTNVHSSHVAQTRSPLSNPLQTTSNLVVHGAPLLGDVAVAHRLIPDRIAGEVGRAHEGSTCPLGHVQDAAILDLEGGRTG